MPNPDVNRLRTLVDSCKGATVIARSLSDAQMTALTHELCKVAARVVSRYAVMSGLNLSQVDSRLRFSGFETEKPCSAQESARTLP